MNKTCNTCHHRNAHGICTNAESVYFGKEKCVSAGADVSIMPEDVAAMMVLFKMARVATGSYCADSWVDAAGYAACGGEIGGNDEN